MQQPSVRKERWTEEPGLSRFMTTARCSRRRRGTRSSSFTRTVLRCIRDIGRAIDAPENSRLAGFADDKQAILLPVYKLPGANVIQTVDSIKAALPQLQAAIPPTVKLQILSDRTQTIRASVADVQFTLMLTIALVVMVIFVFLRSLWATIIPSVAVPLALVGTFAVMYVLGYSLDNLSLMAL